MSDDGGLNDGKKKGIPETDMPLEVVPALSVY
jgi:hypothetical protein